MKLKINRSEVKKIAVFRALQLGDMLCAIPGIRALRKAYPQAEIVLISLPWAQVLIDRFPQYFDRLIPFGGYPGLPEHPFSAAEAVKFLQQMQDERFDLALQMQGNGTIVNPMISLWGARYEAGFRIHNYYSSDNKLFLLYPNGIHETEKHVLLMENLGIEEQGTHLEFPVLAEDKLELKKLELPVTARKYACIHPGSRGAWRQWPAEHFAAIADMLAAQGLQIILTGTSGEAEITKAVKDKMKYPAIDLTGKTSLGAMGALIRDAAMLVSNCTGVSHISAALKTPSIIISMDGEPERWGPQDTSIHYTFDWLAEQDLEVVLDAARILLNVTMRAA